MGEIERREKPFEVVSEFEPSGDQPTAIAQLDERLNRGERDVVLNRGELARRAFATTEDTQRLNAITHPAIRAESERRFAAAEEAGEQAVIYDMPLLVDLGLNQDMDLTVVVDVDKEERIRRLVDTRGLDEADARARMAQQIDDATRLAAADVVIDNNGPLEALEPQVAALIQKIKD